MQILGCWKNIAHDDKVNLAATWQLDAMQSIKTGQERVWVVTYMLLRYDMSIQRPLIPPMSAYLHYSTALGYDARNGVQRDEWS